MATSKEAFKKCKILQNNWWRGLGKGRLRKGLTPSTTPLPAHLNVQWIGVKVLGGVVEALKIAKLPLTANLHIYIYTIWNMNVFVQ